MLIKYQCIMGYYDGTKLLSLKDINGNEPEIYICSTNRSAGKTTYFGRWFVKRFLDHKEKFGLIYRYNYELSDIANKFFKEIGNLFFPGYTMESKSKAKGIYHELLLNGNVCGYAVSINNADQLKKMSHLFADVQRLLFDEFQSESNHYCDNELQKFQSLHTSIARGNGEQVRRVPVFMLSNFVSLLNPYYVALGISDKLHTKTKFLRGNGFVLEQGFNESAAAGQVASAFNRAFADSEYTRYASQKVYLNDRTAFIERPSGNSRYICTIKYNGAEYGIRAFTELGIVYCDNQPDLSYPLKLVVNTQDHDVNYLMLRQNDMFINSLRYYFEHGLFRFRNLQCKQAVLNVCAYIR